MTLLFVYLFVAIGVSFLCSILEAVLLSITPSYVEKICSEKPKLGERLKTIRNNLDQSISSILILNTFAHTMGAAGVGSQAIQLFGDEWETVIAIALTLIILYVSEIIPKTIGATYWQKLASPVSHIIIWITKLVYPLVLISGFLTKMLKKGNEAEVTREEIIAMAAISHKDGSLFSQENAYLANLLQMREVTTEKILTPRTVVHMLDASTTVSDALNDPETVRFSRIPVYDKDIDHVIGKVIRTDLFQAEREGKGDQIVGDFASEVSRVSEKLPVQLLLDMLIKQKAHLCIVEDEFGQTSGVVTLEDAIETLLGTEIVDESDTVEDMQELARTLYRQRLREDKQTQSKK
jgi:CBS domain containing-hemolysin-like protein